MILCSIDDALAARRYLERGLAEPERENYHGDNMVVHFRNTGEILPYATYIPPELDIPTISVCPYDFRNISTGIYSEAHGAHNQFIRISGGENQVIDD
jgi:hypothetical protein